MATPQSVSFEALNSQLRNGQASGIYVIHGEEGYFPDRLIPLFEALVPEDERDFNLTTIYAPETEPDMVVEACMRYPLMADRQVVILKEAQSVGAQWIDKLAAYAGQPTETTVFVVVWRGEPAKGAKFIKAAQSSGATFFESRKLKENQTGPAIKKMAEQHELNIDPKALGILTDHIGPDLTRISNEIEKLSIALPKGATITPQVVEKLIGVSKDFNNNELIRALSVRDTALAYRIVEYFRSNPKQNSAIYSGIVIFGYFSKLLLACYAPDRSQRTLMQATGCRFNDQLTIYLDGLKSYSARQIVNSISAIRRFDTRAKGIGSRADEYDLLRELIFSILN